jgi:hypothetical protein
MAAVTPVCSSSFPAAKGLLLSEKSNSIPLQSLHYCHWNPLLKWLLPYLLVTHTHIVLNCWNEHYFGWSGWGDSHVFF